MNCRCREETAARRPPPKSGCINKNSCLLFCLFFSSITKASYPTTVSLQSDTSAKLHMHPFFLKCMVLKKGFLLWSRGRKTKNPSRQQIEPLISIREKSQRTGSSLLKHRRLRKKAFPRLFLKRKAVNLACLPSLQILQ